MGKRYYIILGVLLLLFILVSVSTPNTVSWKITYKKKDKNPYGAEVTYAFLEDIFGKDNIDFNRKSPYDYLHDNLNKFNVIYVAGAIETYEADRDAILEFASRGNNIFIASNHFSGPLADTLGLSETYPHPIPFGSADSISLSFTNLQFERKEYKFQHDHLSNYVLPDTSAAVDHIILSESSDYQPHFVKVPIGEGNIFFHSNPMIFTNFNMLQESNQQKYISNCLSYMPKRKTIWNEYFSTGGSQESDSDMRFILGNTQLRWGYMILLSLILIFLVFQSKRRQRAIPIIAPPRNTTLEFVETTGRLYFQQRNHANLAHKKIIFFLEKVRNRFYINTSVLDENFIESLASKSGVPQEEIRTLIKQFEIVKKSTTISEPQLLNLNKNIESFYTKAAL
jgi:hypothetical protein